MKKFELENRLIKYSILIIRITNKLPTNRASNHLASQLIRSGTSVSLNYGEALGGESRRDFTHKIKLVLKELRESFNNLKIINEAIIHNSADDIKLALNESNELISIFVKTIRTLESKG
ncbi:MAG: four helix bundle protein [Bacteroidetes bacterium]|nr:four helix bundle protein [Bacteroidota bacterium]